MQGFQKIAEPMAGVLTDLTRARSLVPTDLGVEFDEGPITLAGTISIWAEKIADEQSDIPFDTQEWEELVADDEDPVQRHEPA